MLKDWSIIRMRNLMTLFVLHATGIYFWHYFYWYTFLLGFFFTFFAHAVLHRWASHSAFKPKPILGMIMGYFSVLTIQGSPMDWAYQHLLHHRFADTEKDHHTPSKGFWHSHIAWAWREYPQSVPINFIRKFKRSQPMLFWFSQNWNYGFCFFSYFLFLFIIGGFETIISSWVLPVLMSFHLSWATNSLAHRKMDDGQYAPINNVFVGIINLGEGFHELHHRNPSCACHGFKRFYHFDTVYIFLRLFYALGFMERLNMPHKINALVKMP